jgi:hypothetical protein
MGSLHSTRALIALASPARIMTRLAKHFEHRLAVERAERSAHIRFPNGACRLDADSDHLTIHLESPAPADLERYQDVIARHLRQVAHDESIQVDWRS